jgi:hypothetical protein
MSSRNLASSRQRFAGWEEAQEYYLENGLTDGLPVVPPTEERVRAMLDYAGLAPDELIAIETIRQKRFTAEKVAINAVMAGCKPEYFPAVVAAVSAICERPFNLHASSTSTNGATVLVLVSGPYASHIGMNAGVEMMGNGARANATIGRAVNLVKTNFYGSVPQDMDNSTFGHPGKITFCFAENLDASPWPALAVSQGIGNGASSVTVFAANAPLQVSIYGNKTPESFLTQTAHAMLGLGPLLSEVLVVISPEIMAYVSDAGWSRQQVQEFLYEKTQRPVQEWLEWQRWDHAGSLTGSSQTVGSVAEPGRITVVPGGGAAGAFIDLIASWGSSRSITKEIPTRR